MDKLALEFLNKSFNKTKLANLFLKFVENYEKEWCKFGSIPEVPPHLTR